LKKVCIYILFFTGITWAQNSGIHTFQRQDSIYIPLKPQIIPLKDWHRFELQKLQIEYNKIELEHLNFISPEILPKQPWQLDMRSSSYYVPRMVRDKLNLIMNRPNETAFVPVLTVAFIALQMANQYLMVREKTQISSDNLIAAAPGLVILQELWKESPKTISQLYQTDIYQESITIVELHKIMETLLDNKLIRMKTIPEAETKFFPAVTRREIQDLIEHSVSDTSCTNSDRAKLLNMMTWLHREE